QRRRAGTTVPFPAGGPDEAVEALRHRPGEPDPVGGLQPGQGRDVRAHRHPRGPVERRRERRQAVGPDQHDRPPAVLAAVAPGRPARAADARPTGVDGLPAHRPVVAAAGPGPRRRGRPRQGPEARAALPGGHGLTAGRRARTVPWSPASSALAGAGPYTGSAYRRRRRPPTGARHVALMRTITGPTALKRLSARQVETLAGEIRDYLISSVSRTGGHLGPNLGVVELTIALHRVFDSPRDTLLFDTGHISYVHKLLTGRHDFSTLRKEGGLSGYPSRTESDHDVIENSHASTSLSWAIGIAAARQLRGEGGRHTVAVIGDGALTGGM